MEIRSTTRPRTATVLAIVQTAIAVFNVVALVVVWIAMRSPEVAQGPHAAEEVHDFRLSIGVLIVAAVATSLAALGLWRRWAWSWGLTVALALTVVIGMLWGPVFDHDHMESDDVAVTLIFAATLVLALLGPVVRWYVHRVASTTVPSDSAQLKSGY